MFCLPIRRSYKFYLIIPVILYICLMYRMLENACLDNGKTEQKINTNVYIQPDAPSRRIMQLNHDNESSFLIDLAKEYEDLELQRKRILRTLVNIMEDKEADRRDSVNVQRLKTAIESNRDYGQERHAFMADDGSSVQGHIAKPVYLINCTNIHEVKLIAKIGHGVSKQAFKGDFNGMSVAVKMVTRHQSEVKSCIEKINTNHLQKEELRSRCFVFPTMKLMKEILLLEQLDHPGFAQILGYCVRNEESDTSDLHERGVVSVFELGERYMINNIQTFTWQQRIEHAIALAKFLDYLENSPLGSLRVRDFKEDHFLMINGSFKMIDLDDVDNLEPSCSTYAQIDVPSERLKYGRRNECEFDLLCQGGMCLGFNAKQNMKQMNRLFLKRMLFPTIFPKNIAPHLGILLADLDNNKMSAKDLQTRLENMQTNIVVTE